jgi:hypothetical protein
MTGRPSESMWITREIPLGWMFIQNIWIQYGSTKSDKRRLWLVLIMACAWQASTYLQNGHNTADSPRHSHHFEFKRLTTWTFTEMQAYSQVGIQVSQHPWATRLHNHLSFLQHAISTCRQWNISKQHFSLRLNINAASRPGLSLWARQ